MTNQSHNLFLYLHLHLRRYHPPPPPSPSLWSFTFETIRARFPLLDDDDDGGGGGDGGSGPPSLLYPLHHRLKSYSRAPTLVWLRLEPQPSNFNLLGKLVSQPGQDRTGQDRTDLSHSSSPTIKSIMAFRRRLWLMISVCLSEERIPPVGKLPTYIYRHIYIIRVDSRGLVVFKFPKKTLVILCSAPQAAAAAAAHAQRKCNIKHLISTSSIYIST